MAAATSSARVLRSRRKRNENRNEARHLLAFFICHAGSVAEPAAEVAEAAGAAGAAGAAEAAVVVVTAKPTISS